MMSPISGPRRERGRAMRTISRNTDWARTARAYALAALVLALVWASLLSLLV